MKKFLSFINFTTKYITYFVISIICIPIMILSGVFLFVNPTLPDINQLKKIKLQVPLQIYTKDGKFLAEFAEEKRVILKYNQIPKHFISALLAAEDNNFFQHNGVDLKGIIRAIMESITNKDFKTGGSTLTMQLVKIYLLSNEKTITRKISQIILALRMEKELSKEEILEMYVNTVFLGNSAYGIEAASNVYHNKHIEELTIAQLATIAGLPQAPSTANPITNPKNAIKRRNWILGRMRDLGRLTEYEYNTSIKENLNAQIHTPKSEVYAPYISEMARLFVVDRYKDAAYRDGLKVYTTIESDLQNIANESVKTQLLSYDKRHGYRGAEGSIPQEKIKDNKSWIDFLSNYQTFNGIEAGAVLQIRDKSFSMLLRNGQVIEVSFETMLWAKKYINENISKNNINKISDILKVGDIIRVQKKNNEYYFSQIPKIQSAFVSIDPRNGDIKALIGGFSFEQTKFNRVTQAKRQPGSSFKPFIYASALDKDFTAASIVYDDPIIIKDNAGKIWNPKNDNAKFMGPIPLRKALYLSRNLAAIYTVMELTPEYVSEHVQRFGFNKKDVPAVLSLALGSASLTPLEVTIGWATFANGGYKVEPSFIERIEDSEGKIIYQNQHVYVPSKKDDENKVFHAKRVLDERTAFIITNILQDVINKGTARKAKVLKRNDLAGKTGTTNEARDLWFSGYNADVLTTVWVGFDDNSPLGKREYGSTTALPIWVDYMEYALKNKPNHTLPEPKGLTKILVDSYTGAPADAGSYETHYEYFKKELGISAYRNQNHIDQEYPDISVREVMNQQYFRYYNIKETTNDSTALDLF